MRFRIFEKTQGAGVVIRLCVKGVGTRVGSPQGIARGTGFPQPPQGFRETGVQKAVDLVEKADYAGLLQSVEQPDPPAQDVLCLRILLPVHICVGKTDDDPDQGGNIA